MSLSKASRSTISRGLLDFGLVSYQTTLKPLLTSDNIKKRVEFCHKYENWSFLHWQQVIFSDESNFKLINRKNIPVVRRMIQEKYDKRHCIMRVQGGGGSVGIWGCISINGAGVCRCYSNRMNTQLYIETMENCLKPSVDLLYENHENVIYQQDNAPCHKSRLPMAWFEENSVEVMNWPAKSPDLNPIEHIWSLIDQRISGIRFDSLA